YGYSFGAGCQRDRTGRKVRTAQVDDVESGSAVASHVEVSAGARERDRKRRGVGADGVGEARRIGVGSVDFHLVGCGINDVKTAAGFVDGEVGNLLGVSYDRAESSAEGGDAGSSQKHKGPEK